MERWPRPAWPGTDADYECPDCTEEANENNFYGLSIHHAVQGYATLIRQIQAWVGRCLENHQQCQWPEDVAQLPTRVIELNIEDGTQDIRLVDGKDHHGQYGVLSYCWGSSPESIFQTTTINLQQNYSRITFEDPSFNKLFRDTIVFLRSLGISYLWIDALCIIQDDKADWLAEASKMASVYSNAYLTISASVSTSPDSGLFYPENSYLPTFGPPWGHPQPMSIDVIVLGSLAKRGWCLQERCLSRRILHFGEQQIHWECPGATCSEHVGRDPTQSPEHVLDMFSPMVLGPRGFRGEPEPEQQRLQGQHVYEDPYHRWYEIMKDYTGRLLTKETDRIPALLGLINKFEAATGDSLHSASGLWRGDMVFGLLWSRERDYHSDSTEVHRPDMPTWSWLSVAGMVEWPMNGSQKVREQVLAITALSLDEATMSITLRGKLARLGDLNGISISQDSLKVHENFELNWDIKPPFAPRGWNTWARDKYAGDLLDEVHVLLIVEPGDGREQYGHGLLLAKGSTHTEMYRRVGYVELPSLRDHTYHPPISSLLLRTISLQSGIGLGGIVGKKKRDAVTPSSLDGRLNNNPATKKGKLRNSLHRWKSKITLSGR